MARDPEVQKILDRYERGTKDISDFQQRTWEARSYLAGQQWIGWNLTGTELRPLPRRDDRVRATVNRVGPDSRRIIAKLTAKPLSWEVIPSLPDDATRRAAALGEAILASSHADQGWESVRLEHAWATWEGGSALIAVDWDPEVGTALEVEGRKKVGTGDVRLSVVPVTEVATVPGTRDIRCAPWWIRAQALPPEEVRDTYGLDKVPAADATGSQRYLRRALTAGRSNEPSADLTRVLTLYERPMGGREGRVVTVVGEEIVQEDVWPFPFADRLNVAVARTVVVPGRWAGHAIVWDAIEPQTLYNQSWSTLIEHSKHAGNARIAAPYGAIEDIEELSDTPGEFLEYNPVGDAPRWLSPPSLPDWLLRQPEQIAANIDDILGVHDVSRGVAPRNIESGVGLAILDENDQTPIGAFARELAGCWSDVGRMALALYEAKVGETREARVVEDGMPPWVEKWSGKDLMGQHHAVVPVDSFTPRTKAAKQALAVELVKQYPDQIDFKTFARLAELDVQVTDTVDVDCGRAQRENFDLAQGRPVLVHPTDDDAKHMEEHRAFCQTRRFQLLSAENQELVMLHMEAHVAQMSEKAAKADSREAMSERLGSTPAMGSAPVDPQALPPETPVPLPEEGPVPPEGGFPPQEVTPVV